MIVFWVGQPTDPFLLNNNPIIMKKALLLTLLMLSTFILVGQDASETDSIPDQYQEVTDDKGRTYVSQYRLGLYSQGSYQLEQDLRQLEFGFSAKYYTGFLADEMGAYAAMYWNSAALNPIDTIAGLDPSIIGTTQFRGGIYFAKNVLPFIDEKDEQYLRLLIGGGLVFDSDTTGMETAQKWLPQIEFLGWTEFTWESIELAAGVKASPRQFLTDDLQLDYLTIFVRATFAPDATRWRGRRWLKKKKEVKYY
jgi:hypothetical protein